MKEIKLKDKYKTSLVVPLHGKNPNLGLVLDSLLHQKEADYEIIVVDDTGGGTNLPKILSHFSFDRRLRVVEKEKGTLGEAINFGMEHAQGEFVTWCSPDCVFNENWLEVMAKSLTMAKERGVEFVYSSFAFIDAENRVIQDIVRTRPQPKDTLAETYEVGVSFLYTRELADKVGEYWERPCENYNWVVRAAEHTDFACTNSVLVGLRPQDGITEEEAQANADCKALARALHGE